MKTLPCYVAFIVLIVSSTLEVERDCPTHPERPVAEVFDNG